MTELDKITTEVSPSSLQQKTTVQSKDLEHIKKEIEDFFSLNLDEQRKFREGCFSYSKKNTHKILLEMVVDILDKSKTSSSVLDNKSEELNYNISKKIVKDLTFGLFNAIDSYTYNDKEMKLFLLGKLIQSLYGRQ
jgi:hypothetical protein